MTDTSSILPFGIQRSTLAGGISGLLTWGITLGLTAAGVPIPATAIAPLCLVIATMFVHFVPDAAKVDAQLKDLANYVPVIDQTYPPNDKTNTTVSNQAWKDTPK